MTYRVLTIVAFLMMLCGFSAGVNAESERVLLSPESLYYFRDGGVKTPLSLAPKIIIRMPEVSWREKEKQSELIQELSREFPGIIDVRFVVDSPIGGVFFLEFLPNTGTARILAAVRSIAGRNPDIEVAPVFIVDNREAVVSGLSILPKLTLETDFVQNEIARLFPGVSLKEVAPQGKTFSVLFDELFFFPESPMPLHLLSLANLLNVQNDASMWIKRVEPAFIFLSEAVTALLSVYPETGTVSEERELVFAVTVYDPAVTLDESMLPRFAEGSFVPTFKRGSVSPDAFFKILGAPERTEYQDGTRRVVIYRYRFLVYVPEREWGITPRTVRYMKDGAESKAQSNEATFSTLPHTEAGVAITDISSVRPLPKPSISTTTTEKPALPEYWFDHVLPEPVRFGWTGLTLGALLLIGAGSVVAAARVSQRRVLHAVEVIEEIPFRMRVMGMARDARFPDNLEQMLATLFRDVFPGLPHRFSIAVLQERGKEDPKAGIILENTGLLRKAEALAAILNRRFAPDASLDAEEMKQCVDMALDIAATLESVARKDREETS